MKRTQLPVVGRARILRLAKPGHRRRGRLTEVSIAEWRIPIGAGDDPAWGTWPITTRRRRRQENGFQVIGDTALTGGTITKSNFTNANEIALLGVLGLQAASLKCSSPTSPRGRLRSPTGCAAHDSPEAIHALTLFLDHTWGPIIWSPAVFVSERVVVMVSIVPVNRDRHAGKGWRHSRDYSFAAQLVSVRLVGAELASAAVAMPVAFIEHSGRYLVAGVMSPLQGRNLFVAPDGRWLGAYVPAAFRSYPFSLARVEGSDQAILCIDEGSGRVVDPGVNADVTKFFDEDGRPSLATKATLDFLQQIEWSRTITDLAVAALADARVIQPWPFNVHDGYQQVPVNGLHRINEAALHALDDDAFLKLRKSEALGIAQAQLISMQTIGVFRQLLSVQQQMAKETQRPVPASSSFRLVDVDMFPTWNLS